MEFNDKCLKNPNNNNTDWTHGCTEGEYCSDCDSVCPMNHDRDLREKYDYMEGTKKLFEKRKPEKFESLIAITEEGTGILIKSTPSLFENDLFDGCFLEDNINVNKINLSTLECGVYKCDIMVYGYSSYIPGEPTEYDINIWIENLIKINVD